MQSRDSENRANFKQGRKLFEKEHYKNAARLFFELVKNSSENPEYLYWYARTQDALKHPHNAITYYQLTIDNISCAPTTYAQRYYNAEACFRAALTCKEIREFSQGLAYVNKAEAFLANSNAGYNLLDLCLLRGDLLHDISPFEALEKYDFVLQKKPDDQSILEKKVSVCVKIAESYVKQQNYIKAAEYYEQAALVAKSQKNYDINRAELFHLRTATCYLEHTKKNPEDNISKYHATVIFEYLKNSLKYRLTESNFEDRAKYLYYSYMHDRNLKKAEGAFETLIKLTPAKYDAIVYYYFAEIYATTVYVESTIELYCKSIQKDPGFIGSYEGLYNCLINVKKLNRSNFLVERLHLLTSVLTFPNQEQKIQLLKMLLDEKHPVGQFVLSKEKDYLIDKDAIDSIIQAIPYEQGRKDYLIRACKNQEDTLYKIVHIERNKPGILGGVAQKLADELQSYQKYEHFFDPCKGLSLSAHKQLEKMLEMVPLKWMSENYAFEPVMMSHIIRKFNEFAKDTSDLVLHKQYGAFITRCSAEDLFKAICSAKRPEDKVSPDISKILVDCLDKDTILGKKFLIMKPDKDIVRELIMALPEANPEQLQVKKEILEKVINKHETFKPIFWTPRHFGATVSVEEGTLKILNQALQNINAKLSPKTVFEGFELMDDDIDDFEIVPSNSSKPG